MQGLGGVPRGPALRTQQVCPSCFKPVVLAAGGRAGPGQRSSSCGIRPLRLPTPPGSASEKVPAPRPLWAQGSTCLTHGDPGLPALPAHQGTDPGWTGLSAGHRSMPSAASPERKVNSITPAGSRAPWVPSIVGSLQSFAGSSQSVLGAWPRWVPRRPPPPDRLAFPSCPMHRTALGSRLTVKQVWSPDRALPGEGTGSPMAGAWRAEGRALLLLPPHSPCSS